MSKHATQLNELEKLLSQLAPEELFEVVRLAARSLRQLSGSAALPHPSESLAQLREELQALRRSLEQCLPTAAQVIESGRRASTGDQPSSDQLANMTRLRRELATLPVCNPGDGFSNRDHDEELYGGPG